MHVHDGVEMQPFEPARNAEGHLLEDAGLDSLPEMRRTPQERG